MCDTQACVSNLYLQPQQDAFHLLKGHSVFLLTESCKPKETLFLSIEILYKMCSLALVSIRFLE